MRRKLVALTLVLTDAVIVAVVPFLALLIRFDGELHMNYAGFLLKQLPIICLVRLVTFYLFGLYRRLWRYASIHELLLIVGAVTISSVLISGYTAYVANVKIPNSIYILSWVLIILFVGASRLGLRISSYIIRCWQISQQATRVLVIGAGDAGAMIAREITQRYYETKTLIGYIDDDPYKKKQILFSAKVLGGSQDIVRIVDEQAVNEIIIAMPSVRGEILRNIIHNCKSTKCNVKIVPGIYELIDGNVSLQQLRDVDLEDLLRREPVKLDMEQIAGYLKGKRVLVTGAGGSIGSELCRQISKMMPKQLILLGKGENSIYEIDFELRNKYPNNDIQAIIADVRDQERIDRIFATMIPEVVFHAAAHKHVPLMEAQPVEAVKNNIFGSKNVAEAADKYGTEVFIMISTDKAVNPTSVMGATKRVAELFIQSLSQKSRTKFAAVRFGNVLGSRGSVIPLFRRQIAQGGPITITHSKMMRYFMTIPEAAQLVLQAGAITKGGEVFVLDMGEPVKILDMACDLIELSGLVPHKDIKIVFTGLRPGEKMFEELLTAEEGTMATQHKKIYVANLKQVNERNLYYCLAQLQAVEGGEKVVAILSRLLPSYKSDQVKTVIDSSTVCSADGCNVKPEGFPATGT